MVYISCSFYACVHTIKINLSEMASVDTNWVEVPGDRLKRQTSHSDDEPSSSIRAGNLIS
jgi:hypothetical protein